MSSFLQPLLDKLISAYSDHQKAVSTSGQFCDSFTLNRYLNLFSRIFNTTMYFLPKPSHKIWDGSFHNSCYYWIGYFETGTGSAALFIADIVLVIRLWAIYGKNRVLLVGMMSLLLLTAISSVAVVGVQSQNVVGSKEPIPGIHMCIVLSKVNILYAYWIPVVIFEGVAFLLAAYKVLQYPKNQGGVWKGTLMVQLIFRDSCIYFTLMFIISLTNAMIYRFGRPGLYDVATGPSTALFSIIITRMLINLRKQGKPNTEGEHAAELSTLHFRPRPHISRHSLSDTPSSILPLSISNNQTD
ncbi:hypothetical protein EW146_g6240 [Bondarzewia mesenterica]|uniref:G-protein coupled receptors family 1 profile domain-containing protein n=1 Tax=Bondarzewia mesenterica TaxID=1095465 RepID=A0A4S4LQ63_9AGAM|nr:hypothetical protein EW146_g6240 [Bondarzewia mesenterica]